MRRAKVGSGELKTVGKYSIKGYKCDRCGHVSMQGTNHWGKIYNLRCPDCSWRNPMNPFVTMSSIEKMPKGYKKPKEWKSVRLGDIVEVVRRKGI